MPASAIKDDLQGGSGRGDASLAARLAIAIFWILAMLQGAVFLASGTDVYRVIGLVVAAGSCAFALWPMAAGRRIAGLALLGAAGIANFAAHLVVAQEPFDLRLMQAGVVYGYASLCLAGAGALACRRCAAGFLVSALVMTVGLVLVEAMATRVGPSKNENRQLGGVRWVGGPVPHPVLEEHYASNSEAKTIFPSNPRGYFRTDDPRAARWKLALNHKGSQARLVLPGDPSSNLVRVEIGRADEPTSWHVQLSHGGVGLKKGSHYVVTFQARADRPLTISYSAGQARPPWKDLGLYREFKIDTQWRDQDELFIARGTDDDARLVFNLGGGVGAVELRSVVIRKRGGPSAARDLAEYSVAYRFNSHGCRGPDYDVPAPAKRRRILVLGDSYALGVGVHEEHTFSAQLQALLNGDRAGSPGGVTYDVINCGVSGYATRQERQLFEIVGPVYRPDVVVVAMVFNDASSWRSDVQNGYVHAPDKYERLLRLWAFVQYLRYEGRKPRAEFSGSLKDLLLLRELCERQNARLAVVAFRNHPFEADPAWGLMVETISRGLAGTGVPFLDIGERIRGGRDWKDLFVFPGVDYHPNEIAHGSAAEQIADLLKKNGMLP